MKLIGFLFFLCLNLELAAQHRQAIYLSFNLEDEESKGRRIINSGEKIEFRLIDEQFVWKTQGKKWLVSPNELAFLKVIDIQNFLDLADEVRKDDLEKGKESGSVYIRMRDSFFENIFLLVKEDTGQIYAHEVVWVEWIE